MGGYKSTTIAFNPKKAFNTFLLGIGVLLLGYSIYSNVFFWSNMKDIQPRSIKVHTKISDRTVIGTDIESGLNYRTYTYSEEYYKTIHIGKILVIKRSIINAQEHGVKQAFAIISMFIGGFVLIVLIVMGIIWIYDEGDKDITVSFESFKPIRIQRLLKK